MNKTILKRVGCMLSTSSLPNYFWTEAKNTTVYLINKSPSSIINFKTLQELWYGKPPIYDHLKVFGCVTYAHINEDN